MIITADLGTLYCLPMLGEGTSGAPARTGRPGPTTLVVALVSEATRYMTGPVILIDGGNTLW